MLHETSLQNAIERKAAEAQCGMILLQKGAWAHHLLPSLCAVTERQTYMQSVQDSSRKQMEPMATLMIVQVLSLKAPAPCKANMSAFLQH